MKQSLIKQILKPVFLLAVFTLICGFLARTLVSSETLSEYAAKNAAESYTEESYTEESAHIDEKNDKKENETESVKKENYENYENKEMTPAGKQSDMEDTKDMQDTNPVPDSRTVYQEGFYYEELTDEVKARITGISYPVSESEASSLAVPALNILDEGVTPAVSYADLRYLSVLYYDFNAEVQTGELICHKGIAQDLAEIFYELYRNEYQIEKIRLIDDYQGDDTASMTDNNTSCFNYRVVDGTSSLSKHALGCAIDINPFYNPYVVFNRNGSGETYISPAGSEAYADRSRDFPYKIDENDLCCQLFKEHGFTWGGNWNSSKDYQHFQKIVSVQPPVT